MEVKGINFGSSLLVPSVQELASQPMTTVPPRYVRPEQDPTIISGAMSVSEIPVINMQNFLAGETMESELEKLHSACKDWGFFQLINHGVDSSLLDKIKWEIQEFFKLPIEEKQKLWQIPGDIEGFGQVFVVSEEQKLDWCDMFYMVTLPPHLRKPHLIPNLPPSFREALEVYSLELKDLAMNILAQMAKALKIESEEIKELFEDGIQSMRLNYYPPCPQPESVIGLTPHSDAVALTIFLQVNEMEGLQIKKDGNWVPVKPLPNAFIVNIADMLEIETNGIYRSVEHRATVNSTEKERLSIATFYMPRVDKQIGPLRNLISPETPPLFKTINVGEYFKGFLARKLYSKSYLDDMKL